jgi:cyanophycinase
MTRSEWAENRAEKIPDERGGAMGEVVKGRLLIIGGAEDKTGEMEILREAVKLMDGGRMVVMTTATEHPEEAGDTYRSLFSRLGAKDVEALRVDTRREAEGERAAKALRRADAVFFTGGDQLRITSILGGTKAYHALHEAYQRGALIAGTSAGASALSSTMIVGGLDNDPARKCTLKMAPGLGLLEQALIDQHFAQRGRLGRLLCGVAENPHVLGIGIDEDTAIRIEPDARFFVLGTNAVTIIDGATIRASNVSELAPNETLAIQGATLHVLPRGYGYDMKTRSILPPGKADFDEDGGRRA